MIFSLGAAVARNGGRTKDDREVIESERGIPAY
jgi:hypothetical protein